MNSVKLINFICLVSICFTLELNNKTKNSNRSILLRQKRGLPVSNSQNKLNNDSIKLRLDLNKLLPKISQQRPHIMIQPPITNLRAKPRPGAVLNNRIAPASRGASQPNLYNSAKNIPNLPTEPPKQNAETKPVTPATTNITKSAPEQKTEKFYIEIEDDIKIDQKPDTATPKSTLQSRVQETALTKLKEETLDNKKDKNSVIMGIMRELPDIIKTAMNETVKSEENPIIIKNITEINLPIQRGGETKTDTQVSDSIEKKVQTDTNHSHKVERINPETDDSHCEEVMSLLLKPILQPKQHNAEVPHLISHVSLAENVEVPHPSLQVPMENNAKHEIESIEIIQNKYSEKMEQKHELLVDKTDEIENLAKEEHLCHVPYTTLHDDLNTVPNFYQNVYNADSTYTIPSVQEVTHTTSPNVYNTIPMHSTPVDMYANVYTPNKIYGQYPYVYSDLLQNFSTDSSLCKPECSSAPDKRPQNEQAYNFDDSKNTKWKTWSNTEIFIKTNHNHADWPNQRPTWISNWGHPFYNGCNYCYFQNHVLPITSKNPFYVYPNLYSAYQEGLAQKTPDQVI